MRAEEVGFVARQTAGGAAFIFEPNQTSKWFGRGKIVFLSLIPKPCLVLF